jgi:hypothetical protein
MDLILISKPFKNNIDNRIVLLSTNGLHMDQIV